MYSFFIIKNKMSLKFTLKFIASYLSCYLICIAIYKNIYGNKYGIVVLAAVVFYDLYWIPHAFASMYVLQNYISYL